MVIKIFEINEIKVSNVDYKFMTANQPINVYEIEHTLINQIFTNKITISIRFSGVKTNNIFF